MFARKFVTVNLIVHVIIAFSYVDVAHAGHCSRIPEGSGAKRSPSTGNFRIRFSDDSGVYKPGRQYTIFLERTNNAVRIRDRPRPSFTGFFLAVEQKTNMTSVFSEDFSPIKHGTFKVSEDNTLIKLICGNVMTHTSETAKNEIAVNWTAPEPGSGCVTFRATVIEHRDVWYMDDGPLSKDFCEDEDTQEDYITNIVEECCACYEAKYELTFEGLWSRNTHPKDFPRNVYTTKFGDIIGATHTVGNGFWANGDFASEGLKEVAEMGSTRTLEAELKNKSDSIRTIIKARGLSYPNITGKTFAVFRVDPEHHLVSFVSMISPSPDWFVGVTSLELCQSDCTWLESKIVDLYPWDAGTDKGATYDAPDQPSRPPEYIRRISSESPNNVDSPFYSQSGSKMKPLARLTLLRQRLYEKNCTAEQSENEENVPYDPQCESKSYYSDWTPCSPKCKNSEYEKGKRTKTLKFRKGSFKECAGRDRRPPVIEETCEIEEMCVRRNQDDNNPTESIDTETQTDAPAEEDQSKATVDCSNTPHKNKWEYDTCDVTCGTGKMNRTRESYNPECPPMFETVDCSLPPCKNKDFCMTLPDPDKCERSDVTTNYLFYNATECTCTVFNTDCIKEERRNIFTSFEECTTACPEDPENCSGGIGATERTMDTNTYRRNRYRNSNRND
ncbi:spondin-1-like isoform X2 [Sitodiplosis mosellana]|uniref:spondin-1-like isoform X2 n=1 Tax=Sitodiplosis mosellana TaxID=263140 RepID=UPI00244515C6|nr:spondin-1-like isoform X2 [Sitodiplosis mosellana]